MRNLILTTLLITLCSYWAWSQFDNPYSQFGHMVSVAERGQQIPQDRFYIMNEDTTSTIGMLAIDPVNRIMSLFSKNGDLIHIDTLNTYTVARWLTVDPKNQFYSPYVGMGNIPNSTVDPDGGFNWGATVTGSLAGFGVGSLLGLAVDPDNWWKYGLAGAAIGGIAGASSGDIGSGGRPWKNGWEKFRAEIKFAVQGEKYGVWNTIKSGRETVYFGAGAKTFTTIKDLSWERISDIVETVGINGARTASTKGLNPRSKHSLDVDLGGTGRLLIENQNGTPASPNEVNPKSTPTSGRSYGILRPSQHHIVRMPINTTGVKVTLAWPTAIDHFSGEVYETMGMSYSGVSNHQDRLDLIKIKVKSVHTKFTGGRLFK